MAAVAARGAGVCALKLHIFEAQEIFSPQRDPFLHLDCHRERDADFLPMPFWRWAAVLSICMSVAANLSMEGLIRLNCLIDFGLHQLYNRRRFTTEKYSHLY